MIERLGQALYWATCIIAALVVVLGFVLFSGTSGGDLAVYAALTAVVAGSAFLVGRAARYVLAGY